LKTKLGVKPVKIVKLLRGVEMAKKKLLLVEDVPEFASVAKQVFEKAGYELAIASTLTEAEELLSNNTYDYVLVDGFFPYSQDIEERVKKQGFNATPEEIAKCAESLASELQAAGMQLPFDTVISWYMGKEIPLGLFLAEKLDNKKIPYLIVSAANHHDIGYSMLEKYCLRKDLKLFLEDTAIGESKASQKYWLKVLEQVEEELSN